YKYGKNQVAQIITYGSMAAKSSIKDVARVLDLPLSESNLLAKLVPDRPGTNLNNVVLSPVEEIKKNYGQDFENIQKLRSFYSKPDEVNGKVLKEADRKSTRLNSSHVKISYAVFCLKKKT